MCAACMHSTRFRSLFASLSQDKKKKKQNHHSVVQPQSILLYMHLVRRTRNKVMMLSVHLLSS